MNSKNIFIYIGLLVLSVVVNTVASVVDATIRGNLLGGESGFPLKYGSSSFFGGSSINYMNWFLDVIFWFVIILIVWKVITKLLKK